MVKTTVGAIIERDGKILLTKRNVKPFKGCWCIPGGHIEENETAAEAVRREVKEEVGLDFEPIFFKYFDEILPEIKWHAIVLVFKGKFSGEVKTNEEVSEYKWVSLEESKNLKLAFRLKDILEYL
ncbi:MAG: NUDIX domain-containing protein [Candidatus Aenigmarchaeota archaeon]|nr:NUDIX domain-containing protein [Candidatus Aenigmarchaeota archaeon]